MTTAANAVEAYEEGWPEVNFVSKGSGKGQWKGGKNNNQQKKKKQVQKPQFHKPGKSTSSTAGTGDGFMCWNCYGYGHPKSQCPSPPKGKGKGGKKH